MQAESNQRELDKYLSLNRQDMQAQLHEIVSRASLPAGKRQVAFTSVETLICYGLFQIVNMNC